MREGWEYKKLGEVCNVINGLWTGKKEPFINVAVIRNTNISKDCQLNLDNVAYIDVEAKQFASRKLLFGDIIIEKSGGSEKQPVGRPILFNISEGDYSFSNFTSTLRIKEDAKVESSFLHKCLYAFYLKGETLKLQSKTTGLHNLNMKGYLRQNIPLPPKSTQLAIVSELDKINELIRLKKEQLKDFDNLAQSIFYEMFGEGKCLRKKLKDIVKIQSGQVSPLEEPYSEMIHIGPANIESNTGRLLNLKTAKEENLISGKYLFDSSMVLYSKIRPNLNKVTIPSFEGICSADMYPIIPLESIDKNFLLFLLKQKDFLTYAISNSGRANIPKINREALLNYEAILPPLPLQHLFAQRIEQIEHQKAEVQKAIADLETLLASRMQYWFE